MRCGTIHTTWRQMNRHRTISLLSLIGLSMGLTTFLLITLWVGKFRNLGENLGDRREINRPRPRFCAVSEGLMKHFLCNTISALHAKLIIHLNCITPRSHHVGIRQV